MTSLTTTERNERIAVEVLRWKRTTDTPTHTKKGFIDPAGISHYSFEIPNFIDDPSTMHLLVDALWKRGVDVVLSRFGVCTLKHEYGDIVKVGDTPHAALIAAIEQWIEETKTHE